MDRRQFVGLGGITFGALAIWRLSLSDAHAIELMLYARLNYLKLDPAGVRQFAREFAARHDLSSTRLHVIGAFGPIYSHATASPMSDRLFAAVHHGEERIVTNYLIGSDFFINGADENRVVHFRGLLDPLTACSNPFARPPESMSS